MAMRCEVAQEWMAAYTTGEIALRQGRQLERHLQTCRACKAWHDEVKEMLTLWTAPPEEVPGLDLAPAVMQSIGASPQLRPAATAPSAVRTRLQLPRRIVLYHLGIAASLAFVMFNLGIFQHIGLDITQSSAFITGKMIGFAHYISSL